ncbi:alpha/beta hydrolase family protein [Maricaulis sp.]|uniref:alpha/beta hydrolase family protein n=1 Tax=Maricaulis sp. TaxID=1486257 RepID=UPI002B27B844|nr:alpha/beta fold hydrolase [Maricaulis sp.]
MGWNAVTMPVGRLLAAMLAVVVGAQAGAIQNRPLTINDLAQPPSIRTIQMSPDGRQVAYLQRTSDFHALARAMDSVHRDDPDNLLHRLLLVDLTGPADAPPREIDLGTDIPVGISWAGPDRLIVGTIATSEDNGHMRPRRRSRVPYYRFYWRLVSVHIPTGQRDVLFGDDEAWDMRAADNFAEVVHPLPGEPDHVLVAAHRNSNFDLWRLDLVTGDHDRVERGSSNTVQWAANEQGRATFRLDLDVDDDRARIYRRRSGSDRWSRDESLTLNEFVDYIHRANRSIWAANTDDDDTVLVAVRPEGAERRGVYEYDLEADEIGDRVWEHPTYDLDTVLRDELSDRMIAVTYLDDRIRTRFFDRRLNAHFQALTAYFEADAVVYPLDVTADALLLFVTGPQEPGSYYAYSLETSEVRPLAAVNPALLGTRLSRVTTEQVTTRDGLVIDVFVTHPAGARPGAALPTVIMPHGGPEARDSFGFDPVAQYFAAEGWRILQPNFRGSEGYGRTFASAAHGQWSRAVQDDITDTLQWAINSGLTRRDRVCIAGFSYGGYAALAGAFVTPDAYRCVVSVAGISDPEAFIDWSRENRPDSVEYWTRQIGDPETEAEAVRAMAPVHQISRMRAPILLLHGNKDEVVPMAQTEIMIEALEAAGYDFRERTIRGAGHNFETPLGLGRTLALMEAFMGEYLDEVQPADRDSWQTLTEPERINLPQFRRVMGLPDPADDSPNGLTEMLGATTDTADEFPDDPEN